MGRIGLHIFTGITVHITSSTVSTAAIPFTTASQRNTATEKEHEEKRECCKHEQREGLHRVC